MKLEKLWLFYIALMLPFFLLVFFLKKNLLESTAFVVLTLIYVLFYNPLMQGWKLFNKGIIKKSEVFKMMIPFYPTRYFKEVFFK
jgi:hypothetical protein